MGEQWNYIPRQDLNIKFEMDAEVNFTGSQLKWKISHTFQGKGEC